MQKSLRIIRIVLALLFFTAAILFFFGVGHSSVIHSMVRLNIAPMMLSQTIGVTFVWFIITFIWGRIYCSIICPLGTLQDFAIRLRSRIPSLARKFSYKPAARMRIHILFVYIICLMLGFTAVALTVEPFNMFGNICSIFGAHEIARHWLQLGFGAVAGVIVGFISLILVVGYALIGGRDFCNEICPVGTVLGYMAKHSSFAIAINPDKCDGCLICEDNCKGSCIKVTTRLVDNSRCVRCFDCVAKCPHQAITFTMNRQRPATPLFQRHNTAKTQ